MATIVEQDVALYAVESTLALLSRKIEADRHKGFPPDEDKLLAPRDEIRLTDSREHDDPAVLAICKELTDKYQNLPDKSVICAPADLILRDADNQR